MEQWVGKAQVEACVGQGQCLPLLQLNHPDGSHFYLGVQRQEE